MLTFVLFVSVLILTAGGQGDAQRSRGPGPRLLTASRRYHVQPGEDVTLPCIVTNLGRGSVFWLKGDNPESRELVMQIHGVRRRPVAVRRFQQNLRSGKLSTDGNNLIINHLTADDAGAYTCTVARAGQSVTHVLEVTDSASPQKTVMEYFPKSKSMTVAAGSSVTFACRTPAAPQPAVRWYREGSEGQVLREGPVLVLQEARREDAGRYMCRASYGAEQQQGTYFTLHVQYVSVRAAEERVVVRTEEPRARLTCHVEGYPDPQVSWYHTTGQVTEGARHRIIAIGDMHHLQIEQVTLDDLGKYQCYVHNEVSRDVATVTLSAAPGEARILGVQPASRPETYNVTWVVESLTPLRLYVLEYLKEGANQWSTTFIGTSERPRGIIYMQSGLVTLDPAATYEVRIRGVTQDNEQGPDMTQPFALTTDVGTFRAGTSLNITGVLRTSLPILSRLPALARNIFQ